MIGAGTIEEIVLTLLLWIEANSDYETAGLPPPAVVQMTPEELTAEAYRDNPNLVPASRVDDRVLALYNFEEGENGTIFVLGAEWTDDGAAPDANPITDPVFQERLLHELVHHVQRLTGAYDAFPCRSYGEREAYELGGAFLKQRYARDPLPNRIFWSRIYSRC